MLRGGRAEPGACGITPFLPPHHCLLHLSQQAPSETSPVGENIIYGAFLQYVIPVPDTGSYHNPSICSQTARTGLIESVFWQISDGNGLFFKKKNPVMTMKAHSQHAPHSILPLARKLSEINAEFFHKALSLQERGRLLPNSGGGRQAGVSREC